MYVYIRDEGRCSLVFANQAIHAFNHVVLAFHANQVLQILGECATCEEREILQHLIRRRLLKRCS